MKKEKKKNEKIEFLKEVYKNPRGKAILFFSFYFVFFFVLILLLRNNQTNNKQTTNIDSSNKIQTSYDLKKLEEGNYRFTRKETRGDFITTFVGDHDQDKSRVMMTKGNEVKNFFFYRDMVLEKTPSNYIVGTNPYLYPNLQEYNTIEEILERATLKSKTTYEQGEDCYHYEITTTTLTRILNGEEIDISDPVNIIEVFVDKKEITGITYSLNSYHAYRMNEMVPVTIEIKYSDYGKVEKLEVPE